MTNHTEYCQGLCTINRGVRAGAPSFFHQSKGCRATYFKRSFKALNNSSNHEQTVGADPHAVVNPVHTLQQRAVHIECEPLGSHTDGHMVPLSIRQTTNREPDRQRHADHWLCVLKFLYECDKAVEFKKCFGHCNHSKITLC